MITEPYLILHKVRGQPAFDIAIKMRCPICEGARQGLDEIGAFTCNACDPYDGWWWIVSTSGHRAYPSDYIQLKHLQTDMGEYAVEHMAPPDDDLPDHCQYDLDRTPQGPVASPDVAKALSALIKPEPPLVRRKL